MTEIPGEYHLAYILGAGHCGSTLLNLLLNAHSQMLGLSEIETIGRYARSERPGEENPLDERFWQEVIACYEAASGEPLTEIDIFHPSRKGIRAMGEEGVARWARTNQHLLACAAKQAGASILVDASKFWQRLQLLYLSGQFKLKVLHLVRDGRAVLHSYTRKGVKPKAGLRRWMSVGVWAFLLRRRFEPADWLQVRYEDLAARPEETLQRICAFLQVEYEPGMLAYRQVPDHGIGGNRMCRRSDERIVVDEGWRQGLSRSHRLRFALLGGWLNRMYGYR